MATEQTIDLSGSQGEPITLQTGRRYRIVIQQDEEGYLRAQLFDAYGEPVSNADYELSNHDGSIEHRGQTDAEGFLDHGPVPFDDYFLEVGCFHTVICPVEEPDDCHLAYVSDLLGLGILRVATFGPDGAPLASTPYRVLDLHDTTRFEGTTDAEGYLCHEGVGYADYHLEIAGSKVFVTPVDEPDEELLVRLSPARV